MNPARRRLCVGAGALALAPGSVLGQQKSFRIGFLGPTSAAAWTTRVAAFRQGLREFGYTEGKNITVEYRWADGEYERLPQLARELLALKIDLLVATTTPATRAAQQSTSTVPIVMVNVADPVGAGLVSNLQRPGGNITGVSNFIGDTTLKQFDLLVSTVPRLTRVAVLWNPDNQSMQGMLATVHVAGQKVGVRVLPISARTVSEIDRAFVVMTQERAQALLVLAEPLFYSNRVQVIGMAAKTRLPAIYNVVEYAEAGGLMTYGTNIAEVHRHAAKYIDKILKGAKPGDLPVEQPSTMEFAINLKTAKALGLTIPQPLLLRADRVIND